MAPRDVNDSGREMMAVIARYRESAEGCTETSGTGNDYVLSVPQTLTALADGMRFAFCADRASTAGAATLAVNGHPSETIVGTRTMVEGASNTELYANEIITGHVYIVIRQNSQFVLLNPSITAPDGELALNRIPTPLTGKDADTVDGLHVSTDAEGDDANTLYFR